MAVFIKSLEGPSEKGHFERVCNPHEATLFSHGNADYFRTKAYEQWPSFYWAIEEVAADKYRVKADIPFAWAAWF